jgi:hypothetical protein
MGRISGSLAVLAGLFLVMPGMFALMHGAQGDANPIPAWLVRDLFLVSLTGLALLWWGGSSIRRRELALNDVDRVRIRIRG